MLDEETKKALRRTREIMEMWEQSVRDAVRIARENGVTLEELIEVNRSEWGNGPHEEEEMAIRAEWEAQGGS